MMGLREEEEKEDKLFPTTKTQKPNQNPGVFASVVFAHSVDDDRER